MSTYLYGETISATVTGTVWIQDAVGVIIQRPDGAKIDVRPGVDEIRRVTPADGEPKPGETWRDREGFLWVAYWQRRDEYSDGGVVMMSHVEDLAGPFEASKVNLRFGPLTLVYRPEPVAAAEPSPEAVDARTVVDAVLDEPAQGGES